MVSPKPHKIQITCMGVSRRLKTNALNSLGRKDHSQTHLTGREENCPVRARGEGGGDENPVPDPASPSLAAVPRPRPSHR